MVLNAEKGSASGRGLKRKHATRSALPLLFPRAKSNQRRRLPDRVATKGPRGANQPLERKSIFLINLPGPAYWVLKTSAQKTVQRVGFNFHDSANRFRHASPGSTE